MTTGRINQVTIVRRGWPPAPCFSAGEIVQVTGGATRARRSQRRRLGQQRRAAAVRFPPLSSPGHPSTALSPLRAVWSGRPRRRTQRAASAIAVSTARGYLPLLCSYASAKGQSPTEPNRRRLAAERPPLARHTQCSRAAGAAVRGVDSHYDPPAGEAGACNSLFKGSRSGSR